MEPEDIRLTRLLYTVGPGTATGFGLASISWTDLFSWSRLSHSFVQPWQAEALIKMSKSFSTAYNEAAHSKRSSPPYVKERWEASKREKKATKGDQSLTQFHSFLKTTAHKVRQKKEAESDG